MASASQHPHPQSVQRGAVPGQPPGNHAAWADPSPRAQDKFTSLTELDNAQRTRRPRRGSASAEFDGAHGTRPGSARVQESGFATASRRRRRASMPGAVGGAIPAATSAVPPAPVTVRARGSKMHARGSTMDSALSQSAASADASSPAAASPTPSTQVSPAQARRSNARRDKLRRAARRAQAVAVFRKAGTHSFHDRHTPTPGAGELPSHAELNGKQQVRTGPTPAHRKYRAAAGRTLGSGTPVAGQAAQFDFDAAGSGDSDHEVSDAARDGSDNELTHQQRYQAAMRRAVRNSNVVAAFLEAGRGQRRQRRRSISSARPDSPRSAPAGDPRDRLRNAGGRVSPVSASTVPAARRNAGDSMRSYDSGMMLIEDPDASVRARGNTERKASEDAASVYSGARRTRRKSIVPPSPLVAAVNHAFHDHSSDSEHDDNYLNVGNSAVSQSGDSAPPSVAVGSSGSVREGKPTAAGSSANKYAVGAPRREKGAAPMPGQHMGGGKVGPPLPVPFAGLPGRTAVGTDGNGTPSI